jgi:hypothetical protein
MLNGSLQTTVVCIVHALPAMNLLYVSFGRLTSRTYRIHNVNSVLPDWRGWTPSLPLAHGLGDQLLVTGVEILSCVRSTVLTASDVLVLGSSSVYLLPMRVGLLPDRSSHRWPTASQQSSLRQGTQHPGSRGCWREQQGYQRS